jgi:DNA polymerase III alpha subunit (gram-positive type)
MILLAFDLETTGLNITDDRPIEVGLILHSTGQNRTLESTSFLVKSDVVVSTEVTEITGITQAAVNKFGYDSESGLRTVQEWFENADAIIGHNVLRFDKRVLDAWVKRHGASLPDKLWIDTMTDIPGVAGEKLGYMAANHGFLNLFPHGALADCQTVLKMASMYNIDEIVKRANTPTIVVRAHQDKNHNQDAKKQKFRWNPDYKIWWKAVKQTDVEELSKVCPFDISIADKSIDLDQLWS